MLVYILTSFSYKMYTTYVHLKKEDLKLLRQTYDCYFSPQGIWQVNDDGTCFIKMFPYMTFTLVERNDMFRDMIMYYFRKNVDEIKVSLQYSSARKDCLPTHQMWCQIASTTVLLVLFFCFRNDNRYDPFTRYYNEKDKNHTMLVKQDMVTTLSELKTLKETDDKDRLFCNQLTKIKGFDSSNCATTMLNVMKGALGSLSLLNALDAFIKNNNTNDDFITYLIKEHKYTLKDEKQHITNTLNNTLKNVTKTKKEVAKKLTKLKKETVNQNTPSALVTEAVKTGAKALGFISDKVKGYINPPNNTTNQTSVKKNSTEEQHVLEQQKKQALNKQINSLVEKKDSLEKEESVLNQQISDDKEISQQALIMQVEELKKNVKALNTRDIRTAIIKSIPERRDNVVTKMVKDMDLDVLKPYIGWLNDDTNGINRMIIEEYIFAGKFMLTQMGYIFLIWFNSRRKVSDEDDVYRIWLLLHYFKNIFSFTPILHSNDILYSNDQKVLLWAIGLSAVNCILYRSTLLLPELGNYVRCAKYEYYYDNQSEQIERLKNTVVYVKNTEHLIFLPGQRVCVNKNIYIVIAIRGNKRIVVENNKFNHRTIDTKNVHVFELKDCSSMIDTFVGNNISYKAHRGRITNNEQLYSIEGTTSKQGNNECKSIYFRYENKNYVLSKNGNICTVDGDIVVENIRIRANRNPRIVSVQETDVIQTDVGWEFYYEKDGKNETKLIKNNDQDELGRNLPWMDEINVRTV